MLSGHRASQAAKARPVLTCAMSGPNASTATAVSGPMPGVVRSVSPRGQAFPSRAPSRVATTGVKGDEAWARPGHEHGQRATAFASAFYETGPPPPARRAPWTLKTIFAGSTPIIKSFTSPSSSLRGVQHHDIGPLRCHRGGRQLLHLGTLVWPYRLSRACPRLNRTGSGPRPSASLRHRLTSD